jgi:hypothetical protein
MPVPGYALDMSADPLPAHRAHVDTQVPPVYCLQMPSRVLPGVLAAAQQEQSIAPTGTSPLSPMGVLLLVRYVPWWVT